MVDMVEARKRAKAKLLAKESPSERLLEQEPVALPAKQVLRSETTEPEKPSAYFPVEAPSPKEEEPEEIQERTLFPEPVPTTAVPEDQIDFLQRLFAEDVEEDEAEKLGEADKEEVMEVLVFQLGEEHYGMDILQIAEIIRFVEPTEVHNTVRFLDGIISLRGRMIPVINGRKRLGHAPKEPDKKTRIIILSDNTEYHGILVDSASQVVGLPKKDIEPTPSVVVGIDAEFINGVCEYENQLIILLNLERFLRFD